MAQSSPILETHREPDPSVRSQRHVVKPAHWPLPPSRRSSTDWAGVALVASWLLLAIAILVGAYLTRAS